MNVKNIFTLYASELKLVEDELLNIFNSNVSLIPMIGRHLLLSGGKRIRPLFLLLSAEMCGYKGKDRQLLGAIIEAIHTASLLHDDVIDSADTRRGRPSAHSLWGNQIVILVGDFIYSKALKIAVEQKNQNIMEALSDATTKMTEGEILQLNKIRDPEITIDEYFEIVSAKTGVLISAACKIGAALSCQPKEKEDSLARFGLKIGMAFQLVDDILDYVAKQDDLGKKLGKDLSEGKITMPLIHLLKSTSDIERQAVKDIIKNGDINEPKLQKILKLFAKYNAIEESLKAAQQLVADAKSELEIFPDSTEKSAIIAMAEYAMQRER